MILRKLSTGNNASELKDWQAEACVKVMLYCCRSVWLPVSCTTKWDFSKICRLYDILGDIYSDQHISGIIDALNIKYSKYYENPHFDVTTNCRLVRESERERLYEICATILDGYTDYWSVSMKQIIEKELQFS